MSTTKKYIKFVAEPMGYKRVTELPGIGEVLGGRLAYAGYTHVSDCICHIPVVPTHSKIIYI